MGSKESKEAAAAAGSGTVIDVDGPGVGPVVGPKPDPSAPIKPLHPEYLKLKSAAKKEKGDEENVMHQVYSEDLDQIDHRAAMRIPPVVKQDFNSKAYSEAGRYCYELEKTMARCIQDKMWTAWKCQKERDTYYKCLHIAEEDVEVVRKFRWKYNAGVYHGEMHSRNHIMNTLWKEYFPDRDLPHLWAEQ